MLTRNAPTPNPVSDTPDRTRQCVRPRRKNTSPQIKDHQIFSNQSYICDYDTVNNTWLLCQQLLHTSQNSQNMPCKETSEL